MMFFVDFHFNKYASVNFSCVRRPPSLTGNCRTFARLVSPRDGALANLAQEPSISQPWEHSQNICEIFKAG